VYKRQPQEVPKAEPLPEYPPWEEEEAREEDPAEALNRMARLLSARLLWVRKPKAPEAEEPVSEDSIGGNGIMPP